MTEITSRLVIYCLCVAAALLIHGLVFGVPYGSFVSSTALSVCAAVYVGLAVISWRAGGAVVFKTPLALLTALFLGYAVFFPLVAPNAMNADGLRAAVLSTPLWPQIFVSLFCGIIFLQTDRLEKPGGRRPAATGIGSFVCFGTALTFAFFAGLRTVLGMGTVNGLSGAERAVFGSSAIHYLIFAVFFIILAYTAHAAWSLGTPNPLGGPRRRFIKILIGTLPLLGFLGTVLGIMHALGGLPGLMLGERTSVSDLSQTLAASFSGISLAFETTMLGLICSLLATVGLSYVEKLEAEAVLQEEKHDGGV